MGITVKQALEIGEMKRCRLLAGKAGITREICFINAMEQPDISGWMGKNELMITTGYVIQNNENQLLQLIRDLNRNGAAGLVIKTCYFDQFPNKALELADELSFPLLSWPDDMAFVSLSYPLMAALVDSQNSTLERVQAQLNQRNMQVMHNHLFADLIAGAFLSEGEADERATALNWPRLPIQLIFFDIRGFKSFSKQSSEMQIQELRENATSIIFETMIECDWNVVILNRNDTFTCIVHVSEEPRNKIEQSVESVLLRLWTRMNLKMRVGISAVGDSYISISQMNRDVEDAVDIARKINADRDILFIEDIRLQQLLKNIGKSKFPAVLHVMKPVNELAAYDEENGSSLLETLDVFVKNLGAKRATADHLFLHRNTLTYRLRKIETIIGLSLEDSENLFLLSMGLRLKPFL